MTISLYASENQCLIDIFRVNGIEIFISLIYRHLTKMHTNFGAFRALYFYYFHMPWNLEIGEWSTIGRNVHILNAAPLIIGNDCNVSERAYICCASHNIQSDAHEQVHKPVVLKDRSWVAAEAFVGMGVTIGEGAVVGARAAVFKDVEPWTVVGGNPAIVIKNRVISRNMNCINHELEGASLKIKVASCRPLSIFAAPESPLTTCRFYGERRVAA